MVGIDIASKADFEKFKPWGPCIAWAFTQGFTTIKIFERSTQVKRSVVAPTAVCFFSSWAILAVDLES